MNHSIRIATTLAALGAAVLSQAVVFSFTGQTLSGATVPGVYTTTRIDGSLAAGAPFNAIVSGLVTHNDGLAPSNVVFTTGGADASTLTITFNGAADDVTGTGLFSASSVGTITGGTGAFAPYVSPSNMLTITSNTFTGTGLSFFSVLGNVNPVPEPTSVAALAIGGLGLIANRRRKA